MGYPVRYRDVRPASRPGGFQPGTPANDNYRPGTPANDNTPRPKSPGRAPSRNFGRKPPVNNSPRKGLLPGALSGFKPGTALRLGAMVGRVSPIIGAAGLAYELWQLYQGGLDLHMRPNPANGWTLFHECAVTCQQARGGLACTSAQRIGPHAAVHDTQCTLLNAQPANYNPTTTDRRITVYEGYSVAGSWRGYSRWKYVRPAGSPNVNPRVIPRRQVPPRHHPAYFPDISPHVDPMSVPPGAPAVTPQPIPHWAVPHRRPNPNRAPSEQPQRGPRSRPRTRPRVRPNPNYRPDETEPLSPPATGSNPNPGNETIPGIIWTTENPTPQPYAPPHARRPPGRGEKETKKVAAINSQSRFGKIVGAYTEMNDFVDAFFEALPKERQRGAKSTLEKLNRLYRYIDEIDMTEAFFNVVTETNMDRFWGKIGKTTGEANRRLGKPVGVAFGPAL